ncbi:Pretoxin HINT domain-containing protein [Promicromonospora thailandica]|uniref:Pretoxin HINT domain-containing protein n=1 Tax=Promicromonospora thailandica TaxID=765201 RepID=A0A9X2G2G4_9MICO|nr:Pretoxin HINT domain-containing protein [Promicromonospora thailandica]
MEDIRVGDKVWAHDLVTGRDELQVVVETFVRSTGELFHLTIGGQRVSTTAEHPFWVQGRGWVDAAFLREGDLLVTSAGATTPVQGIQIEQRAEQDVETVYNFHVQTHSNYYVYAGTTPVLVHNASHGRAINWSSKSTPTFGHTFSRHGAGKKMTDNLTGRAATEGKQQGQWIDDDAAADLLRKAHDDGVWTEIPHPPKKAQTQQDAVTIDIPEGTGQVILPGGEIVPATKAVVVPRYNGMIKDAYPILETPS